MGGWVRSGCKCTQPCPASIHCASSQRTPFGASLPGRPRPAQPSPAHFLALLTLAILAGTWIPHPTLLGSCTRGTPSSSPKS